MIENFEMSAKCPKCGQNSVDFILLECLYCGEKYPETERKNFFNEEGMPINT